MVKNDPILSMFEVEPAELTPAHPLFIQRAGEHAPFCAIAVDSNGKTILRVGGEFHQDGNGQSHIISNWR